MEFSVTLIHGTYARGAGWTKPEGSKLCGYLKTQFGEDVQFDRFEWEAPNSHEARSEASRKLLDEYKIGKRLFQRKDTPHFVIAHSHGGSVLAYALRDDPGFAEALAGIAFLSTPFIQARERLTARWVLKLLPWVVAFLVSMIVIFLWLIVFTELGYSGPLTTAGGLILVLVLCGMALLSFSVAHAVIDLPETGLPDWLKSRVQPTVSQLDLSDLKKMRLNEKTLILRANADEASSSLAAAHIVARLLGEIPARIARLPSTVGGFFMSKWEAMLRMQKEKPTLQFKVACGALLLGALFLFTVIPAVKWLGGSEHFEANWPVLSYIDALASVILFQGLYMGALWSFLAIAFISVSLASLATPMIALLFRVAYGRWLLLSALFIELSVETTPPGEWRVNQLDLYDELAPQDFKDAFALTHSMSYDDPRAHKIIADWIRERLAAETATPSSPDWR